MRDGVNHNLCDFDCSQNSHHRRNAPQPFSSCPRRRASHLFSIILIHTTDEMLRSWNISSVDDWGERCLIKASTRF